VGGAGCASKRCCSASSDDFAIRSTVRGGAAAAVAASGNSDLGTSVRGDWGARAAGRSARAGSLESRRARSSATEGIGPTSTWSVDGAGAGVVTHSTPAITMVAAAAIGIAHDSHRRGVGASAALTC
jgi:hypothetical protein